MDIPLSRSQHPMDTPAPSRPYRHGNLPNAMRAAARAILDETGPDEVSLRETARRVGVSATAAYRHFSSKEDLLASLAAEGFKEMTASMEAEADNPNGRLRLGLAYVDFALKNRGMFRLMFGPILAERAKYPSLNSAAGAAFDAVQKVVGEGGSREDDRSAVAALSLVHGLSSLFIDGIFPEGRARGLAEEILLKANPWKSESRSSA